MENPEEILHHLEEFSKLKPKSIPRELEEYLCFVAKTGDPVYQWSVIKCLFREKLINVITEFYESCPSVDIPPCPNVDIFNYDTMKTFILEKLDTFVAAPFTVQRICELLTTPRKEYNRIDKYMRALEKNILVVSTTEPGHQRSPENGDGFVNGIESDHLQDGSNDINIEEMDDAPIWPPKHENDSYQSTSKDEQPMIENIYSDVRENNIEPEPATSSQQGLETVITCCPSEEQTFIPVEPAAIELPTISEIEENQSTVQEKPEEIEIQVANEATNESPSVPAVVQRRRNSIEPINEQIDEEEKEIQRHQAIITTTTIVATEENKSVVPEEAEQPQLKIQLHPQQEEAGDTIKDDIVLETKHKEEKLSNEPTSNSEIQITENVDKAAGDIAPLIIEPQVAEKEIQEQPKEIEKIELKDELPSQSQVDEPSINDESTPCIQVRSVIASDILQEEIEIEPIKSTDSTIHEAKLDSETSSSSSILASTTSETKTVSDLNLDVNLAAESNGSDQPQVEVEVFDATDDNPDNKEIQNVPEIGDEPEVERKFDENVETPMEVDLQNEPEPAIESTDSTDPNN